MAARAMWKGVLHVGASTVPVKLYSAVQDRSVHFRLLRERAHEPVAQKMVNPATDEPVPYEEARKGFALEGGQYVMLSREELASVEPPDSREIHVTRFVSPKVVSSAFYLRPYYLGPDGDEVRYFALQRALREEGLEGVARWVMRKTEYNGVLRAEGDYLMLITLRHAEEVIDASELPQPQGRAHNEKEARMAEQLIESYSDVFDPSLYHDDYRERLLAFIEAKAKGKAVKLKKPVEKAATDTGLADALAASLKQVRKAASRG